MRPNGNHSFTDLHEKARLALADSRLVVIAIKADSPTSAENTALRQEFGKPQQLAVAALTRLKKRFSKAFWELPEATSAFSSMTNIEQAHVPIVVSQPDRTARGGNAITDEHLPFAEMFEHEPNGLIYCRMLYGPDGQPCDFTYLAANRAFRTMIGMGDIVGKNGLDVHTCISAYDTRAFHHFRNVVETGNPERFELFIERSRDTVLVTVSTPLKGIFAASFSTITERRKLEQDLLDSERKYRAIFESSSDAIMLNTAEKFIDCNAATLSMFGCTREEFLGKHPGDVSPPHQPGGQESHLAANRCIQQAFENGKNFFDWVHRRKDGTDFPAEVMLTPVLVHGQRVLQASVRDISERRELELKAHERKIALKRSQALAQVGSWSYDVKLKRFSWSDEMLRIFGIETYMSSDDAYAHIRNAVHSDDKARVDAVLQAAIQGNVSVDIQYRILLLDGTQRHIWARPDKPTRDAEGNITKFSGIIQDVTDRKWTEERYRTILSATMDGFWMVGNTGHIIEVNDAYCKMSGYSREELTGKHVSEIEALDKRDDIHARMRRILQDGHDRFESQHRSKDGRLINIEASVTLIPDSGGTMISFIHDITVRKLAESEHLKMQRLEALGVLAGGIAHDFNNLLTGIVGNASIASESADPDTKHTLDEIVSVGKRATWSHPTVADVRKRFRPGY